MPERKVHLREMLDLSKEDLYNLYWKKKMTTQKMAELLEVPRRTLENYMKKLGIRLRTPRERMTLIMVNDPDFHNKIAEQLKLPSPPKEELEGLYFSQEMALDQIAHHYGVAPSTVLRWFKHYGIPRRKSTENLRFADSFHQESLERAVALMRSKGYKVLVIGKYNNSYIPDALLVKHGKIFSLEVERRSYKPRIQGKLEKADLVGFDGVFIYRTNKIRGSPVKFHGCGGNHDP